MRPVRWVDVDDNCAVTTVEAVDEGAGPYATLAIEGVLGFETLAEFDAWAAAVRRRTRALVCVAQPAGEARSVSCSREIGEGQAMNEAQQETCPHTATAAAPTLRSACAEAMLAGALLLSDVSRDSESWRSAPQVRQTEERFRKALEAMREALAAPEVR
jgi:hypothetical protein